MAPPLGPSFQAAHWTIKEREAQAVGLFDEMTESSMTLLAAF